MDTNGMNGVIEIEDDIIDLDDTEKTTEEIIYEWDAKIRKKLLEFAVADNENILDDLMKEYLHSLRGMVQIYYNEDSLKNKVYCHIKFLHSSYVELQCCTLNNYLNCMEDILTVYCNLELQVISALKKKRLSKNKHTVLACARIIRVLKVYLFERCDHIFHVIIKLDTSDISDSCSDLLSGVYVHFLTKVPIDSYSDESFCRQYILFQKWKEIRKSQDWKEMDKFMYHKFKRTPESVKNSETLRKILMPTCNSTVGVVLSLFRLVHDLANAYFKHLAARKTVDVEVRIFDIDLGEDEPILSLEECDEEETQIESVFNEVEKNMSSLPLDTFPKLKEEEEEDDDVEFVSITLAEPQINFSWNIDDDETPIITRTNEELQSEEEKIPVPTSISEPGSSNGAVTNCTKTVSVPTEVQTNDVIEKEIMETTVDPPLYVDTQGQFNSQCEIENIPSAETENHKVVDEKETILQNFSVCINSQGEISSEREIITPLSAETENHQVVDEKEMILQNPSLCINSQEEIVSECEIVTPPSAETENHQVVDEKEMILQNIPVCINSQEQIGSECEVVTTPSAETENHQVVDEKVMILQNVSVCINSQEEIGSECEIVTTPSAETENHQVVDADSEIILQKIVQMKDAEVQADGSGSYNNYGLATPPFEVPNDDYSAPSGGLLYTNISQCHKQNLTLQGDISKQNLTLQRDSSEIVKTRNVEVQVEPPCLHDFGLTPPNDPHLEDHVSKLAICINTKEYENVAKEPSGCSENDSKDTIDDGRDADDEIEDVNSSETGDTEEIDVEYCQDHLEDVGDEGDPINKGQEQIQNTEEVANGNVFVRTNGQIKEIKTNILYSHKIRPLHEFSQFEDELHGQYSLNDILSGPVSNIRVRQEPEVTGSRSNSPSNSQSSSPTEMTSPDFEEITDFKKHYDDVVTRRVPLRGILKKKKMSPNRHDGVLVPKRVRNDMKLNMVPAVRMIREYFIENKLKKLMTLCAEETKMRVDYDKTTTHINKKDVVRRLSPPRLSGVLPRPSRPNAGKVRPSVGCSRNQSCCKQLTEEFNKLNCKEETLNLAIPDSRPTDPELEFSNSPTFLQDSDRLVQLCLQETSVDGNLGSKPSDALLCDNSNYFYKSQTDASSKVNDKINESNLNLQTPAVQLPTPVPETYDFEKNFKNEVFSKIDLQILEEFDFETRLPLKKRKVSVPEGEKKEEISYPATPMISIAEVEALHPRKFKTPAERKEMPPISVFYNVDSDPSPIIADQFNINNHTYNNPTINYHMNNVPVPFINIPCGSYYSLSPILLPFNNVSNFEQGKLNSQAQEQQHYAKKENRKQGRQRRRY